jgi:protein-tyrosine phosphatase
MHVPNGQPGVDIHFHLLPGLDDGPAELSDSIELARMALTEGTGTVVVTPHVRGDFVTDVSVLPGRVREVEAALARERLPLRVRCGGELGHDMVGRLRQGELDVIAQGPPGGRWILLETPFGELQDGFHAAADELRDRGFAVVLAHPERSADAALAGSAGLRRELARGSVAQVNAMSVTGRHGEDAEHAAMRLIFEGLVAVIGSDAHGPTRPPSLAPALRRLIERGVSVERARLLTSVGPRRLLARGVPATPLAA